LTDKALRRAGLDYREYVSVRRHADWPDCRATLAGRRIFALSSKAGRCYGDAVFLPDDVFLFGPETRGLPAALLNEFSPEQRLRLPMRPGNRSLNLANAAAVTIYEAWRQQSFR
jgi:tRNA (cytidine/uridine-2'-O-)-methyltransferase